MKKAMILLLFVWILFGVLVTVTGNENSLSTETTGPESSGNSVISPSATPVAPNPIRIVFPVENAHLPALSTTYVYGSVAASGKLFINDVPVPVHPEGGFLTVIPLAPGKFEIKAQLIGEDAVFNYSRMILVDEPEKTAPVSPLTIEYVTPLQNQELVPGDEVEVVCKGSPGLKASFTVKGLEKSFPMFETKNWPGGIYHGVYRVGEKDQLHKSRIKVTLTNKANQKISKESGGALSLFPLDLPVMMEVASPDTILYAGSALASGEKAGYVMFPPVGTLLRVTGKKGDEYRVRLTKTKTVWVNANQVKPLPQGTFPARVMVGSISMGAGERSTRIRIPLARKIPFKIDPDGEGGFIDVSFFGAFSNTDWIFNASTGAIKSLRWFQDDEETYRLRVYTIPNSWWGYDARYEGNMFVLELRTPPATAKASGAGASPLSGLTIAIDAGHAAGIGVLGPTGYAEGDANFAQALNLKEKLLAKGVNVIMIRKGGEDVVLQERPKIAWQNKADILISLHNNALDYDGNPLQKHGFGVYYYTPMSLPAAKEIHEAYCRTFGGGGDFNIRDDGLNYGSLALTRSPQMPCIIIESVYMVVPEEEAYLKLDSFRSACADAIISGMERYARQMRPAAGL
ncbi:MAG TPA: N-acetylmuramoyl-L-alanine amidase [Bacillota bacterium]|nr:N-acetylmuramoyl-L-alanine amidase [Bacillota bacterium]